MNQVYSLECRKKTLGLYAGGISVQEIIQRTGVSRSRIYKWIQESNLPRQRDKATAKPGASSVKKTGKMPLTLHEKKALVDAFRVSKNKKQFALEHGIPRSTLYRWAKQNDIIQARNGKTIDVKMYLESIRSQEKLQKIIDVLHHAHCTVFDPLKVKMAEMDRLADSYGIRVLCEAFMVDRGTYINHLKRNKGDNSWFHIHRTELKKAITEIFHEHKQIPGIRKVYALLIQKGYHVSVHMVGELMQELGLHSIRNSAKQVYLTQGKPFSNEINVRKRYSCYLPNQIWSSDFTSFNVGHMKYCVCIIIDLCSRKVVAHKVGRKATTQMLTQCFHKAISTRMPESNLVFHSDQGAQYTSFAFKNLLREKHIIQSFSRKGTPTDNGEIECFNSSFKREELYRHIYLSEKKFKKAIADYITYYNEKRPHEALNNMTPAYYEKQLLKQDCPNPASKN